MSITKKFSYKTILEILVFPLAFVAINLFFPEYPGFLGSPFNPYLVFILIAAANYGKIGSIVSFIFSVLLIMAPFPFLRALFYGLPVENRYWIDLLDKGAITFSIFLITSFIIGVIRDSFQEKYYGVKEKLKIVARGKGLLQRETKALKKVNFELEKRVLTQKDSIISLYSRIQKLYSSNFKKSLEIIIETITSFTGATSCSIWEYKQEEKALLLLMESGWNEEDKTLTRIETEHSIEGWVVRNNIMFSAKMVMQYDNLKQMDSGRNIFTVPILAGLKVWGVLNIESLPFEKYNLYNEKLLLIIMTLIAPTLERAIQYENFSLTDSVDPVTNLPLFSQFYNVLGKEITRIQMEKGNLSIVILEMNNYSDLIKEFTKKDILKILKILADKIEELAQNKAFFYHYKSDNQLSLIYPDLSFDGCSLFCLNLLEMINSNEWVIHEKIIYPEIILGYSSVGGKEITTDEVISAAENLLDMQKV